jgi:beta-galactosidase GanA
LRVEPNSDSTVEERDVIDLVAVKPEGDVILGLVWLGPLDSKERNLELQERINIYLAYWDSGQLVADFPDAAWKDITIRVMLDQEPGDEGQWFLGELTKLVKTLGVGFEYQLLEA